MGWDSGNEIFDPVCDEIVRQTEASTGMYPDDAFRILAILIKEMQRGDWDTEDESLDRYLNRPYVVKAFAVNGIKPYERSMETIELPTDDDFSHGGEF